MFSILCLNFDLFLHNTYIAYAMLLINNNCIPKKKKQKTNTQKCRTIIILVQFFFFFDHWCTWNTCSFSVTCVFWTEQQISNELLTLNDVFVFINICLIQIACSKRKNIYKTKCRMHTKTCWLVTTGNQEEIVDILILVTIVVYFSFFFSSENLLFLISMFVMRKRQEFGRNWLML